MGRRQSQTKKQATTTPPEMVRVLSPTFTTRLDNLKTCLVVSSSNLKKNEQETKEKLTNLNTPQMAIKNPRVTLEPIV